MKRTVLLLAAVSSLAWAQPSERPNQPVFRSGPWFVVRSVREGGSVVACTGFYRADRHVQLSKDTLIVQTTEEVKAVALGFDDQPVGAQRPLSAGEKDLKAIALEGEDFKSLARSRKVRMEVVTPQGTMRHELDLRGLAGVLENIEQGCPVPADKPVRRMRARH